MKLQNDAFQGLVAYVTNNVISKLLFNKRYDFDDKKFLEVHHKLATYVDLFSPIHLFWVLPEFISKFMNKRKRLLKVRNEFIGFCQESYQEREEFADQEPECASDYLWKQFGSTPENEHAFSKNEIATVLVDFYVAGQETTTTSLAWLFLNLLHKPDIQHKVYEELRQEFPNVAELIPFDANAKLPYTMATMNESMRFTPALISTLEHAAEMDIEDFHGFTIAKGTRMFPNLLLLYRNEKYWKDASHFNPENFLDESGNFVKSPYLLAFGAGPRLCPGDAIAKMEMFMVFANIIRRYQVCPVDQGQGLPGLMPVVGTVSAPVRYEINLKKRLE